MYTVTVSERLVFVKFGKVLSFDAIKDYAVALGADPSFDPTFSEIIDISESKDFNFSTKESLKLADMVDPFSIGARRAFVARTLEQIHAAQKHQLLRNDKRNTQVFSTVAEAKRWIQS